MSKNNYHEFGSGFERALVSLMSVITGIVLIYLAIKGPLGSNEIHYKTHPLIINQLLGQDLINVFPMSLLLIIGGVALYLKKHFAKYILILTPLYLFYYAISYTIGWEWMALDYSGNSEQYFFYFLYVIISALVIMLYCLSVFPTKVTCTFKPLSLGIYSFLMTVFLLLFASMWIKQIVEVMNTGATKGYEIAPTAFWLVRTVDLGFCIPLGLISIYLLWKRPQQTFPIQFMFFGFFITQILAVLAMGISMGIHHDPNFKVSELVVFGCIAIILFIGFFYIVNNYKINKSNY